jgi:signal transduction histidine kinase
VYTRDGRAIYCDAHSIALRDAEGNVIGFVAANHDITSRKQAEEALRASQEQLRAYSRLLVEAVENERRSTSRKLHDSVSQTLTAMAIGLGQPQHDIENPQLARQQIDGLRKTVNAVTEELHRIAVDLRPITLDRYGLVPALRQLVESYRRQTGLGVDLLILGIEQDRLPPDVENALYRIVSESYLNR